MECIDTISTYGGWLPRPPRQFRPQSFTTILPSALPSELPLNALIHNCPSLAPIYARYLRAETPISANELSPIDQSALPPGLSKRILINRDVQFMAYESLVLVRLLPCMYITLATVSFIRIIAIAPFSLYFVRSLFRQFRYVVLSCRCPVVVVALLSLPSSPSCTLDGSSFVLARPNDKSPFSFLLCRVFQTRKNLGCSRCCQQPSCTISLVS